MKQLVKLEDHFRADLHCHSHCSDGSDEPAMLVKMAKELSLQGLSITDHDTIAAYTPELFALAEKSQILLLPGVEISSELEGVPVHILGYGYDLNSLAFASFLQQVQGFRQERNRQILKKLAEKKMWIEEEEFSTFGTIIGRPHIAFLMVKKGYVSSIREAFALFLQDDAPCYVRGFKYDPQEVIHRIHQSGGKAVLAHPHFYKQGAHLKKILSYAFDGIECYYASLAKEMEMPWLKLAQERGLIATGGSDYHGSFKNNRLGSSWSGLKEIQKLAFRRD
ncbi:MAG TPA: PHP domain-containing protein [Chlamydiales bacterium]|nr:PHP domain-containing protein [Chlamydiales bacterium]